MEQLLRFWYLSHMSKVILETSMCSNKVGLEPLVLDLDFIYVPSLSMQAMKAFAACICDKYQNLMGWLIQYLNGLRPDL